MARILHIAPFNTAGVPLTFVQAERALGHESRLLTLGKTSRGYPEDICLDLPFLDFGLTRWAKKLVSPKERLQVNHRASIPSHIPRKWQPTKMENQLIKLREKIWTSKINQAIQQFQLLDFDVYQLDGGLEFYRDGRIVRGLKQKGKKIICCYTGSDLRVRGVIPEIDALSDLNVTVEFDHQFLHPNIHHVLFPINPDRYGLKEKAGGDKLKIGHAPTSRRAKGSHLIIPIVRELEKQYPVELVLIEKLPYPVALKRKAQCQIFIDQIGDLGYGINALEALCMGIATCSCLAPGFEEQYPDHPFITINEHNLKDALVQLIEDEAYREKKGQEGRAWVRNHHDYRKVVQRIHRLAGLEESQPKIEYSFH
ncbi:MAG: glycosyltransferase [candidate division KSB1 bacterium]|nr:glycosyltransferase [candidate division KSB1 bacterium]